jgi:hypothetical protein
VEEILAVDGQARRVAADVIQRRVVFAPVTANA